MPSAKDSLMGLGVAAAVAMGAAGLVRPIAAVAPLAPSASMPTPPRPAPPDRCKQACDALPDWCPLGRSVTCTIALQRYERESADGGPHFSCSEPIDSAWLDVWCPNHGEQHPLGTGAP